MPEVRFWIPEGVEPSVRCSLHAHNIARKICSAMSWPLSKILGLGLIWSWGWTIGAPASRFLRAHNTGRKFLQSNVLVDDYRARALYVHQCSQLQLQLPSGLTFVITAYPGNTLKDVHLSLMRSVLSGKLHTFLPFRVSFIPPRWCCCWGQLPAFGMQTPTDFWKTADWPFSSGRRSPGPLHVFCFISRYLHVPPAQFEKK